MFDTTVSHPALKLTAVLENEPAFQKSNLGIFVYLRLEDQKRDLPVAT